MLRRAVDAVAANNTRLTWLKVAACVSGKSQRQCRERWRSHIDPALCHDPFDADEDNIVKALYATLGSSWTLVAQLLNEWRGNNGYTGTRCDRNCKNYILSGAGVGARRNPAVRVAKKTQFEIETLPSLFGEFEENQELASLTNFEAIDFEKALPLLATERPLSPVKQRFVKTVRRVGFLAHAPSVEMKRTVFSPFKTFTERLLKPAGPFVFRALNGRMKHLGKPRVTS